MPGPAPPGESLFSALLLRWGRGGPSRNGLMKPLGSPLSACREVFKAKHRKTGKKVALKKVLMENEKEGVSTGGVGGPAVSSRLGVGFPPCFC